MQTDAIRFFIRSYIAFVFAPRDADHRVACSSSITGREIRLASLSASRSSSTSAPSTSAKLDSSIFSTQLARAQYPHHRPRRRRQFTARSVTAAAPDGWTFSGEADAHPSTRRNRGYKIAPPAQDEPTSLMIDDAPLGANGHLSQRRRNGARFSRIGIRNRRRRLHPRLRHTARTRHGRIARQLPRANILQEE